MEALRLAQAAGYNNLKLVRSDRDFDPPRGRRDFRDFLLDVAFPRDPFARRD